MQIMLDREKKRTPIIEEGERSSNDGFNLAVDVLYDSLKSGDKEKFKRALKLAIKMCYRNNEDYE